MSGEKRGSHEDNFFAPKSYIFIFRLFIKPPRKFFAA